MKKLFWAFLLPSLFLAVRAGAEQKIACFPYRIFYGCSNATSQHNEDGSERHYHQIAIDCQDECGKHYLRYFYIHRIVGKNGAQELAMNDGLYEREGEGIEFGDTDDLDRKNAVQEINSAKLCVQHTTENIGSSITEIKDLLAEFGEAYSSQIEALDNQHLAWRGKRYVFEVKDFTKENASKTVEQTLSLLKSLQLPGIEKYAVALEQEKLKIEALRDVEQKYESTMKERMTEKRGGKLCVGQQMSFEDKPGTEIFSSSRAVLQNFIKSYDLDHLLDKKILSESEYDQDEDIYVPSRDEPGTKFTKVVRPLEALMETPPRKIKQRMQCEPEEKDSLPVVDMTSSGNPSVLGYTDVVTPHGTLRAIWAKDAAKRMLGKLKGTKMADEMAKRLGILAIEIDPQMQKDMRQAQSAMASALSGDALLQNYIRWNPTRCRFEEANANDPQEIFLVIRKEKDEDIFSPVSTKCAP